MYSDGIFRKRQNVNRKCAGRGSPKNHAKLVEMKAVQSGRLDPSLPGDKLLGADLGILALFVLRVSSVTRRQRLILPSMMKHTSAPNSW